MIYKNVSIPVVIVLCQSWCATVHAQGTAPDAVVIERRQAEQKAALLQQTTRTVNVNTLSSPYVRNGNLIQKSSNFRVSSDLFDWFYLISNISPSHFA